MGHPWLFQLGRALLLAEKGDPSYTWLKPDLNSTEPFDLEIGAVLMEILQDLR